MGVYTYKAVDSKGKTVKGELEAKDELEVSTQLAKLGYLPISIGFKGEKQLPLWERFFKKRLKKASSQALIIFTRQFATIIKAAIPIVEGLKVLGEQSEDENLKEALNQIIHDIEEGHKLSEAMVKHPGVFNQLYVNTVVAGEAGGVLDKVLLRLANVLEEEQETKTSIKSALRYPIMVIIALFVAVFVLSGFVVPQFAKIYAGMKVSLPLPTRIMIFISNSFRNYWYITFPLLIGFFYLFKLLINTPKGRWKWDELKFKTPVIGKIYKKIVMLRFASMLNVLYQTGLPILKTLDIVKITIGNVVLSKEVDNIKKEVADGKGISGGILSSKLFPKMVAYMVSIGEKAGALPAMLDSLCEYYTLEVRTALKNLTSLIEPIMTAVLGVVVMGMALAIFLPMWNLVSVIRQAG
jgi:type II secretory pathway component PulF